LGDIVDHSANKAVSVGATNVSLVCKSSDKPGSSIEFYFEAAGFNTVVNTNSSSQIQNFDVDTKADEKVYRLYIKRASVLLAGLYYEDLLPDHSLT